MQFLLGSSQFLWECLPAGKLADPMDVHAFLIGIHVTLIGILAIPMGTGSQPGSSNGNPYMSCRIPCNSHGDVCQAAQPATEIQAFLNGIRTIPMGILARQPS